MDGRDILTYPLVWICAPFTPPKHTNMCNYVAYVNKLQITLGKIQVLQNALEELRSFCEYITHVSIKLKLCKIWALCGFYLEHLIVLV